MNETIIENLGILVRYYKNNGDFWRERSYRNAIVSIKSLDFSITDINQIKSVKGIGKTIREKIKEYLDTGQIMKVEEIKKEILTNKKKNDKDSTIELFETIWGIGIVKARELYQDGMRSLEDLEKNKHLLTTNQKIGLKFYKDFLEPIPREYIDCFQLVMKNAFNHAFGVRTYRLEIAGSYRRDSKQSGDIDCLITSKTFNLTQLVDVLKRDNIITDILSMRNEKFMGVAKLPNSKSKHFRLDIEFVPEDQYGSGLLYFTGSKAFNIAMRTDAKKKGYTLNQHGLFNQNGERIPVYSEAEIMAVIGMKYVPPNKR